MPWKDESWLARYPDGEERRKQAERERRSPRSHGQGEATEQEQRET